jgi:hypothetical protein
MSDLLFLICRRFSVPPGSVHNSSQVIASRMAADDFRSAVGALVQRRILGWRLCHGPDHGRQNPLADYSPFADTVAKHSQNGKLAACRAALLL